jgi:hypothetical protein
MNYREFMAMRGITQTGRSAGASPRRGRPPKAKPEEGSVEQKSPEPDPPAKPPKKQRGIFGG